MQLRNNTHTSHFSSWATISISTAFHRDENLHILMLCVVALGPPRLTTISIDECIMPSDQFQKEGKNREELLSLIPSTVFQSHFSE